MPTVDGGVELDAGDSQSRDFATAPTPSNDVPNTTPQTNVHYLNLDTNAATTPRPPSDTANPALRRTDTQGSGGITPIARRRTRVGTFKTVQDFQDFDARPGWRPGAEPGVDPSKPDGGHASMPNLSAACDITIIDFSQDNLTIRRLDNETLDPFLNLPQPKWSRCRWINVNRLSWDVIKALGRHKNLHKLAIEDLMNTRNRTKADWYPTHAFMVLTLQKLVQVYDSDDSDSDIYNSDEDMLSRASERSTRRGRNSFFKKTSKLFRRRKRNAPDPAAEAGEDSSSNVHFTSRPTGFSDIPDVSELRTLQKYHAAPNDPRTQFMEKHSALSHRGLAVSCEQVSIFITQDNTIISFFELSAQDVETPIIRRLQTSDTIIRQSCDASLVGQAIIDAIIDLSIPVTACYGDVIGDLEIDVLTRPTLEHTKSLYIVITEIHKMLSFINPIVTLINTLRDHKFDGPYDAVQTNLQDPTNGVIITPTTYTYLGDVLDHCVLISESLVQLRRSADGMIDLIFNTISAYQNESMKQLTTATIIFLPLTFITGYFGQNFVPFDVLTEDVQYFWKIAVPVVFATILLLRMDVIYDYCKSFVQRRYILGLRKTQSNRRKLKRR